MQGEISGDRGGHLKKNHYLRSIFYANLSAEITLEFDSFEISKTIVYLCKYIFLAVCLIFIGCFSFYFTPSNVAACLLRGNPILGAKIMAKFWNFF